MKRNLIQFLTAAALCSIASLASAQALTVAGGGGIKQGSTYSAILGELATACADDGIQLSEVQTSGGPQNLELLKGNKVAAAIVQTDILFAAKLDNATSVANIKTVVALHPEPIHLVVRADAKTEGGVTVFGKNIGGDTIVFKNAEDLKGRPVGAVGGSVISARILGEQLRYGWQITEYAKTTDLLQALSAHKIDAAIIVAGAPSAAVAQINGHQFKLLPIRGNSDTAAVYNPAKIQYPNLNGGRAVDTLSEQALLVTRTWKSDDMLKKLGAVRACFNKQLPNIQDRQGTHPAWQDMDATQQGKWVWYDLPKVAVK